MLPKSLFNFAHKIVSTFICQYLRVKVGGEWRKLVFVKKGMCYVEHDLLIPVVVIKRIEAGTGNFLLLLWSMLIKNALLSEQYIVLSILIDVIRWTGVKVTFHYITLKGINIYVTQTANSFQDSLCGGFSK